VNLERKKKNSFETSIYTVSGFTENKHRKFSKKNSNKYL